MPNRREDHLGAAPKGSQAYLLGIAMHQEALFASSGLRPIQPPTREAFDSVRDRESIRTRSATRLREQSVTRSSSQAIESKESRQDRCAPCR